MNFAQRLEERIEKQHCLGCKVAIVVNILWALSNYFIFEENAWVYIGLNLSVALTIAIVMLNRKHLNIKHEAIGLIPMLTTVAAFAYMYNTIELEAFQVMTYTNVAVFIGAGMFLLWRMAYSIFTVVFALTINISFYFLFSPLTLNEYMMNGGFMMVTVAIFMVFSIQARYNLVSKDIKSQIALEKSQKELKTSEEQHRLLFEKNPTPMLICSLETLMILAVNDLVIKKYGYTREEFIGMKITDLHKEIDFKDVILCAQDSSSKNDKVSEWVHVLKDQTEIDVELVAKSIDYDGKTARLVSINDVTEVKTYQNELIEAKQFAEKSKELQSQFLSNMSHEIRTPMNGILGITRILQNSPLDEEQQHYLNAIIKSSENLMVIINDILDFSKIEAGKIELEKTRFDLDNLLSIVQEILIVKAEEKDIYLRVEKDDNVPKWIEGDPVRLNQILNNLISNAVKFTDAGGVTVKVSANTETEGISKIKFEVKDTGIGIPNEKIDTIFQSFTQASSSTTRTHGGTGLGLTITKQLIELQDGEIEIESAIGKGSTFSFDLNYKILDNGDEVERNLKILKDESNEIILERLKGANLLLVEDHPINQMLATKVLEDWGFNVDHAENGLVAVNMTAKKDYDLILMDISMPVMDGYRATKEIRSGKFSVNSEVPIIAMTASAFIGDNQKCFKAGMNGYVTKPFDPQILLEKIASNILINQEKRA